MDSLLQKGKTLLAEFSNMDAESYASSIAFFSFMSLVPLLAICISLVSVAGISEQQVVAFFTTLVPDALNDLVSSLVGDAFERSGVAFSLSTITLLWSASMGVRALRRALNVAYAVDESRSLLALAGLSVLASLILGVLLALMMCIIFSGSVMRVLERFLPSLRWQAGVSTALYLVMALVVGALALCACYTWLAAGARRYASQLPGAMLASLACGVLSLGFRVYVDHFSSFTVLYGSIATVALFLYWMYLMSYILIAGGFLNRVLSGRQ